MEGLTDAQFATLEKERARYGATVTPIEIGRVLNDTAWQHRDELGLQRKDGGLSVQPRTNIPIWNGLWIKRGGLDFGVDCLLAASIGTAKPVRVSPTPTDPRIFTFVPPVAPIDVVDPPPPPPPPSDLAQRVAALEKQLAALTKDVDADALLDHETDERLHALEQKAAPDLTVYAKKGDPVTVSGRVSVFGLNRWTGRIDV